MSLEAVKQVTEAEEAAKQQKLQAQQDARRLVAEAEKAGEQLVLRAGEQAKAESAAMLRGAEDAAAEDTAKVHAEALADADRLRAKAEGRLEEAASLIVRRVVDA